MKILAVIVTYNSMQWIKRCLDCVNSSSVAMDALVVDNCSTDETREYIPANYPEVIWRPQDHNLGFGQANNLGMRYAVENAYDYVLLLNQDAYLQSDAIEHMLKVSDAKSLISPLHLNGDGTRLDTMFRVSMKMTCDVSGMIDDLLLGDENKIKDSYESAEIAAACWFMPVSIIKSIGGFNPLFFHYSEDNNYYQRMQYHGIKTIVVPKAHVWHDRKELYGNVNAFNHKRLHRDFLLITDNINYGVAMVIMQLFRLLAICLVYDLPKKNYRIGAYTKEMFWTLFNLRKIRRSRKAERKEGLTWL